MVEVMPTSNWINCQEINTLRAAYDLYYDLRQLTASYRASGKEQTDQKRIEMTFSFSNEIEAIRFATPVITKGYEVVRDTAIVIPGRKVYTVKVSSSTPLSTAGLDQMAEDLLHVAACYNGHFLHL